MTTSASPPTAATSGSSKAVVLGICGGVGPAAGVLLHHTILEHTAGDGRDQSHLSVCHLSRSEDMTDRTEFLQRCGYAGGGDDGASSATTENPACGMARTFAMMQAALAVAHAPSPASSNGSSSSSNGSSSPRLVLGVPCNTFHAKPIWDEFLRLTAPTAGGVLHVHMLEETVRFIAQHAPASTRIGLLATTGTRQARVYHDLLEPRGYQVVEVPPALQDELHASIYDSAWGIKSTAPAVTPRCVANFQRYARLLAARGAEVIVMGCTEIPFAFAGRKSVAGVLLIDPLVALARAMIREADPSRLKRLELQGAGVVAPLDKLASRRTPAKKHHTSCWSPR